MTVETDLSRVQYATNGTTGPWSVPFYFLASTDLRVVLTEADGLDVDLALTTHYSVTGAGVPSGGSITTVSAYPSGSTITVLRNVEALQPTDYADTDAFPANTLERNLDRLTMLAQQTGEKVDRAVLLPVSFSGSSTLPGVSGRAGRLLAFDGASGDPRVSAFTEEEVATAVAAAYAAGSAAAAVTYTPAGTGAMSESVQTHLRRTIWLENFNSVEEALIYAVSLGGKGRGVRMTGGKRFTRLTKLEMGIYPGVGLYCIEGTAEMYFPASAFNNTTLGDRYNSTGAAITIHGEWSGSYNPAEGQFLIGFHITSEVGDGRVLDAVQANNTRGLRLEGLTFSGFPVGTDIRASTWDGGRIDNCRHMGRESTHLWPQQMQSTAIEFDNDRINDTPSVGVQIIEPWGRNFTITGQSNSAWNDQTDFINLAHQTTTGFTITSPNAANFGEGIDIFGKSNTVINPNLRQMKTYALKFIHGASFNTVSGGSAEDVGVGGVVFAGTSNWLDAPTNTIPAGDTRRNVVKGFSVIGVDYENRFSGGEGCVSFVDAGGATGKPRDNMVEGGHFSLGTYGKYAVHDQSTGSGNVVLGFGSTLNGVSGATVALIVNGGTTVEPALKTLIRVNRSTTQAIPNATRTLLIHDATNVDRREEHNTTTGLATMQYPGPKRVSASVRFAGLGAAGVAVKMYIERNGTEMKVLEFWSTGASDESFSIDDVVDCVAGQTLGVSVYQASGSSKNTTAGSQYTTMTIEHAA